MSVDHFEPSEPTRRGFLTTYPPHRYWRAEALDGFFDEQPLNVYVHFPYCIQRCAYCHYKTTQLRGNVRPEVDRYVAALCAEVELVAARFSLSRRPVATIYFGGGTPTLLNGKNLSLLMEALHRHLRISDPEITFEAEPVTLTPGKADLLKRHGVSRISLGIQSFCDDIVRRTGRSDSEAQAVRAVEIAKATGAHVNIDLLSGLEAETEQTWAYSVDRALAVQPHCITVYKMELYTNTSYHRATRNKSMKLPTDEEELGFMRHALERFRHSGYLPLTSFTFGRGGRYAMQHDSRKWRGEDLCALGVSAFGWLGNTAFQNTNDPARYLSQIEQAELPVYRGYSLNSVERIVRQVVLGMKLVHLDLSEFRERHGVDLAALCAPTISDLSRRGFLSVDDDRISLTEEGILFADHVARCLGASVQRQLAAGDATGVARRPQTQGQAEVRVS